MYKLKKIIGLFVLIFFLSKTANAQSEADIVRFEKEEKTCLDSSRTKTNCVTRFKRQMDSLVQTTYNLLYKNASLQERAVVEKDQREWLEQQKAFNIKTDNQYSLEVTEKDFGETAAMMALSEKADFVRDRARVLVKRLRA